jgi:hypothetical protein
VQPRVAQDPAVVGEVHRLVAAQQPHDDVGGVVEQFTGAGHVEPDHRRVRRQRTRTETQHEATARQVVEEHRALGHPERVVVGGGDDARPELDVSGAAGGRGDEDLRGRDDLRAGRVVLADPGLVVPAAVEPGDGVEVALEQQRRVLPRRVERRHEDPESHPSLVHENPPVTLPMRPPSPSTGRHARGGRPDRDDRLLVVKSARSC